MHHLVFDHLQQIPENFYVMLQKSNSWSTSFIVGRSGGPPEQT